MRTVPLLVLTIFLIPGLAWCLRPPDQKTQRLYQAKAKEAAALFDREDYAKCEEVLAEADALWPGQPESLNLHGVLHYKKKEYAEALASFEALLKVTPNSMTALFNIAEVKLIQKKYDEALQVYQKVLELRPEEACQFKVVVVLTLKGDKTEAGKYADKIPHPGQSPAYYYAQAAVAFASGDQEKGKDWLKQADLYYPGESPTFYRQTLIENGWLKE